MDDKIIVTNRSVLAAKYGTQGLAKVRKAVQALVDADKKRGLRSRLVFLDDAAAMKKLKGKPVTAPGDTRQNKAAIDAVFKTARPEYLLILGSIDVVPHQDMHNALFEDSDDPDKIVYGDLPYACDAPFSRDVAPFKGPTRVVGRLPDLTGAKEPSYLLKLLAIATGWKTRPAEDYGQYFGLTAKVWQKSTAESLFNIFGNSKALRTSPASGPNHTAAQLAPLSHFINCHGDTSDPFYYGESSDGRVPKSLGSDAIEGKIKPGTVATAECCYGAQLYNAVVLALPMPISQRYLAQGAYAFFGSSTIAYGPAEGNGSADLITQYFLLALLEGSSTGRAALTARQRFIGQVGELDPFDLKTLAQFSLMGDPSIHPACVTSATSVPKGVDLEAAARQARIARRAKLRSVGEFLEQTKPTASRRAKSNARTPTVRAALANIAKEAGMKTENAFSAFDVKKPAGMRSAEAKASGIASRYHVAVCQPKARAGKTGRRVAAVAKEVDGRIVGYRIYEEKSCPTPPPRARSKA
jgi:hypothetical protein